MTWTFERRLLAAAVLAWAVVAAANLVTGPPLGHDEAAFAIVARGDAGWLYRSRGVVVLAELGVALGGAEWQLRLASTIAGLGIVLAVFAVGRAVFGARTGAWAAAVIAGAFPMASRSAELLGDLPATAGVLAGIAVLAGELDRPDGPRRRVALAAPAFAAAFYVRYGSAPVIAIAGLAALAVWWQPIRRRPRRIAATAALFVALLAPHFAHSIDQTGTLLGVLRLSSDVPRRAYWGEGLVTYVTSNPFQYYGVLVTPAVIAALVGLAGRFRRRAPWFLAAVAFGQLLSIGIQSHAQPRYVFIAIALLVVLGVDVLRGLARPRIALAMVAAAWLGSAIVTIRGNRSVAHSRAALLSAAQTIRGHRSGGACTVIAGGIPQIMWYSGCNGVASTWDEPEIRDPTRDRYLVSLPYWPLDGAAFAAARHMTLAELPVGDPRARVWQIH